MNKNLAFDFLVDKQAKTITVKREFAAEVDLVWDAYTKKELLDQWWAPKPWKAKTKTMDFRVNGRWLYAMVGPQGEEHWSVANYKSIELHKKFVGVDSFTDAEGTINTAMPQSNWEVTFTAKGDVTLVEFKISYTDLAQLEATIAMGFKEGFTMTLNSLDDLWAVFRKQDK
ncbi:MAG TPA: SRPBCC domain-containing protein [Bacteroidia bacterium]|jgi:uncharacterized protein YndB with AHSA1/START domain|nr:SRPBCC domain-containing protein [Bacteroidia bacterium]